MDRLSRAVCDVVRAFPSLAYSRLQVGTGSSHTTHTSMRLDCYLKSTLPLKTIAVQYVHAIHAPTRPRVRCREAHCIVTGTGWAALAVLIAIELAVGRSFVLGTEGLVFLAIFVVGVGFEALWRLRHGTSALVRGHRAQRRWRVRLRHARHREELTHLDGRIGRVEMRVAVEQLGDLLQ
jgi:hypothetical protein